MWVGAGVILDFVEVEEPGTRNPGLLEGLEAGQRVGGEEP